MDRLVPVTAKKAVAKLRKLGFVEVRQRGSHLYLKSSDGARVTIVPMHGGADLPKGTLHSIVIKQAEIRPEDFNKA